MDGSKMGGLYFELLRDSNDWAMDEVIDRKYLKNISPRIVDPRRTSSASVTVKANGKSVVVKLCFCWTLQILMS